MLAFTVLQAPNRPPTYNCIKRYGPTCVTNSGDPALYRRQTLCKACYKLEQILWRSENADKVMLNKQKSVANRRLKRQQAALLRQHEAAQQQHQEAGQQPTHPRRSVHHLIATMTPAEIASVIAARSQGRRVAVDRVQLVDEAVSAT